jgi:hypothetical protein
VAKTPPTYNPPLRDKEAIGEVNELIDEAKRWHNGFSKRVERRYESWRGMLPENIEPSGWRSNQHPPYLINIVEGMLASLEEENPQWTVSPRAIPGMTMEEALATSFNAELSSYLLTHQMRVDGFGQKTGPLAHQDLIAGLTVGKVFWLKQDVVRKYLDETPQLIYDETGGTIDIANQLDQYEEVVTIRDDPTLEVRDVRDWMWPESATSLSSAPWVIDRTLVTYDTLRRMEELGVYQNVKYVREPRYDEQGSRTGAESRREMRLNSADRTRGLVEIVELWTDKKVVTVANREVLLRNAHNPFAHGRKPFVVCSAIPDLFRIPGISVIEGLAAMQEMLWSLVNMRLDATRIASNVITLVRGDVDDPEQYEFAPEAQWIVPDPNAVRTLDLTAVAAAAQSTLQSEGLLRGDIQNVMGGLPFTGGSQSQTLPTDTATGVSIITNIAQAILARRKAQYQRMFGEVGQMFLELDQQFLREDRLVEILGEGNARRYLQVGWQDVQGIFDVELQMQGESLMRQEKRAENQSLLTTAMQSAAIMAQSGDPLNLRRFWEKLLDSYGVVDKTTFFADKQVAPPSATPGTPEQAQTTQDNMNGSQSTGGVTNESLAAGPSSPSTPVSMSPGAPMQRALARVGAGRSA